MTYWSDWRIDDDTWDYGSQNPYANWWRTVNADRFGEPDGGARAINLGDYLRDFLRDDDKDVPDHALGAAYPGPPPGFGGDIFPVPRPMANPDFEPSEASAWLPSPEQLRAHPPDKNEVIVGIVDEGISLSHRMFLDENGNSRILAAWQQNANWEGPNDPARSLLNAAGLGARITCAQEFLPFGRELYQRDVDELIGACSAQGYLDQDLFNSAAGLTDFSMIQGHRALAHRAAHGTHVAGLAAGDTPHKIIAVNLPNRKLVGLSGSFLEYFFFMGVLRIIGLSDRLFEKRFGPPEDQDEIFGYPIVINLSFSKQAGARNAVLSVWRELANINLVRASRNKSKVHFVFPAGNDNLLEGVGEAMLLPKDPAPASQQAAVQHTQSFELLVPPEDQSSSFVEIWTTIASNDFVPQVPLQIALEGPGGMADSGALSVGGNGAFRDLIGRWQSPLARLYSTVFNDESAVRVIGDGLKRQRFVLALRPTLIQRAFEEALTPGVWKINLSNEGPEPLEVRVEVQSDQSALPGGASGLRPRLLDPSYHRYESTSGRRVDSYTYGVEPVANTDDGDFVKRHGTINAVAAALKYVEQQNRDQRPDVLPSTLIIAGYRASDGRPSDYSSTGFMQPDRASTPVVSFPTEDYPATSGVLSDGSFDGSAVALSGTSFAAAQATRLAADFLAMDRVGPGHEVDLVAALEAYARDVRQPAQYQAVIDVKSGIERLPTPRPTDIVR